MSPDHRPPTSPGPRRLSPPPAAPVMPEVMDAMTAAVARRPVSARRRRRWLGRGAVLGVGLALVSGSALAATGTWNPFRDAPPQKNPPGWTLAPPPADQLAALGVLRRPQRAGDQGAYVTAALRRLRGNQFRKINVRYVRVLRTDVQAQMYAGPGLASKPRPAVLALVPQNSSGPELSAGPPSTILHHSLCLWTIYDGWPAGDASPWGDSPPPGLKGQATLKRPDDLSDRISFGGSCRTIHEIRTKGITGSDPGNRRLTGLVPDGVGSVRMKTSDGRVVTTTVTDNSFNLVAPDRTHFHPGSLEWLRPDGSVLRHF